MNSGTIINIALLMVSGGCLYFLTSIMFNKKHKPKPLKGNISLWVKKSSPLTKVIVIYMDNKNVEYYYAYVNGNKANSYKIYKDTLKNFQRIYRKQ